jgi:rhodanese-related sulfurtransferase
MFNTVMLASVVILVTGVLIGWYYRVQILDFLCGNTPPAPTEQLKQAIHNHAMLLDMRMYVETRKEGADLIPEATNIPLLRLRWHFDELPRDKTIITFCVSGKRAGKGADMLNARGFKALSAGGISNLKAIIAGD